MSDSTEELNEVLRVLRIEKDEEFKMHQEYLKTKSLTQRVKDGYAWYPVDIREKVMD